MSSAISRTRTVAQCVTFGASRCRRFNSTEAFSASSNAAASAPILTTTAEQRTHAKSSPSEQLHRALYPSFYQNDGRMINQKWKLVRQKSVKAKGIKPQWRATMKKKDVVHGLSKRFGVPVFQPSALNIKKICPDPVAQVMASQIRVLDPTGARTRLFAKENPERARVGDILLVRQRNGDPFAGVCIDIRRRGVDTAILLRGQLTRVGVEMWYKIYSPLVEGIEVVQRAVRRARRARLTYMRTVKHDRGSVENVVRIYLRQKAALGTTDGQKKKGDAAKAAMLGGKKNKGRGKKR